MRIASALQDSRDGIESVVGSMGHECLADLMICAATGRFLHAQHWNKAKSLNAVYRRKSECRPFELNVGLVNCHA